MNLVEQKVLDEAVIVDDHIILVDSFLNHQMDVELIFEIGKLFHDYFKEHQINRIITCEASGIGIAVVVAHYFNVPMVFAKKNKSLNLKDDLYTSKVFSYTKQSTSSFNIKKEFVNEGDRVLIIDDFLANAEATRGLIDIVNQAKASVVGIGIVIEKGFQPGGQWLRDRGYDLHSLCIIDSIKNSQIKLRNESVI
ncbi:MAG TPA: xanthine phosphoribosyltransferase [Erysipelothrix sp.]|nr:xanthine phosphoribosyltransferase [Erysipelothrix sp.]